MSISIKHQSMVPTFKKKEKKNITQLHLERDRQTDRQTNRQTDRQINSGSLKIGSTLYRER